MDQVAGKGLLIDHPGGGEVGGELQYVAQFPHVARPAVGLEAGYRVLGKPEGAAQLVGEILQNGLGQGGDVPRPLPQRGNMEGEGAQPVVQVLAEFAGGHIGGQVGVAGGHHPHVHRHLLDAAHRADDVFLKGAQQLGLEAYVHLGDLVQEEGAAGGGLEQAHLAAPLGPGKGPLGVAEEFGFQHIGVEVGAVDGHKDPVPAGAGVVDGLGVQLLAGAALALQQHGGVGDGNALGQILHPRHRRGHRHDVVKGVPGAVGLADAVEGLAAAGLHRLQLLSGLVGVLQKGDYAEPPHQGVPLIDGVEVDEVEVLDLLTGDVEDGLARLEHVGQPGARAQIPQVFALHRLQRFPQFLAEKLQIGLIAENQPSLGIDDGDALPHGVEGGSGGGIEFHGGPSQV